MLTKFLPLPDNNGGKQRSLAIARRLAELGDLVLCAYDDGSADRSGLRELGIDVRAVPRRVTPGQVARGVVAARSVSAGRFWSAAMVKAVRGAADEKGIDLLQVEYQQMVPFVLDLPAKVSILDLHNVESALVDSYARARRGPAALLYRSEAAALRRMERRTVGGFDHVVVVSEQERAETERRRPLRPGLPERQGAVGDPARRAGCDRRLRGHPGMGPQRRRRGLAGPRDLAVGAPAGTPGPNSCSWAGTRPRPCAPWPTRAWK